MFNVGAQEKRITFISELSPDFPDLLQVDSQRIQQVIVNLLQNALKFTVQGSITAKIDYKRRKQQLKVSISDTGPGIKQEDKAKLFRLFGKLKDT